MMIEMKDLREVAEELNIKLDLTPKIRKVGISREGIIEQILDAAELILPSDDITDFTNEILKGLKKPKQEKKTEVKKVKVKVNKKKQYKTNKYESMFKKVKVNKKLVKTWEDIEQDKIKVKWIEENIVPWEGWIIGYRNKREGIKIQKDGNRPEFKQDNTVYCVLVIKKPTSNPISVPMDGFEVIE